MSNTEKRRISEEKVWMKHYPGESAEIQLSRCTVWQYVRENNRDRQDKTALHYYGTSIAYGEPERQGDAAADAFAAL